MSNRQSMRIAYGEELVALGAENKNVVVLEADCGRSTMSCMFQEAYPERFFEMGISEQDMFSTAAGLAVSGKIAFANTFAIFATGRPFDQIRQTISIGKLNVKFCGSSCGLSDFGDGSTHQSIEDVAIMSAIPNMTVLAPVDARETRLAVRAAAEIQGPVYIRISRNDALDILPEDSKFELSALRTLREGSDAAIFAHGVMVEVALEAAEALAKEGIQAKVVSVPTLKPFNYAGVKEIADSVRAVVTAEDHSYIGGLGAAVSFALRQSKTPMDYVAVEDVFGQSAHSSEELMVYYGLTGRNIAQKVRALLK